MKPVRFLMALSLGAALVAFTPASNVSLLPAVDMVSKTTGNGIQWDAETINLGEITYNKPVTITFEFTNTGSNPVIITNVMASCGCTATDYPRQPIAAGAKGTITATYNAAAKGAFNKTVTVNIQDEQPKVLNFKGTAI